MAFHGRYLQIYTLIDRLGQMEIESNIHLSEKNKNGHIHYFYLSQNQPSSDPYNGMFFNEKLSIE